MLIETNIEATVVSGRLMLDRRVDLPNESRVSVTIRELPPAVEGAEAEDLRRERQAVFKEWLCRNKEQPINSGGWKFNRDELYERD